MVGGNGAKETEESQEARGARALAVDHCHVRLIVHGKCDGAVACVRGDGGCRGHDCEQLAPGNVTMVSDVRAVGVAPDPCHPCRWSQVRGQV